MPQNWKIYTLGELIDFQKGFAFKSSWYKSVGEIVVRISDTTHNSIDIKTCNRVSKTNVIGLDKYILKTGDIVIASVGSWPPNYASVVGKVIKVPSVANDSYLNQNAVRIRTLDQDLYNQQFIYYLMKSDFFLNYIINTAQGSASQASIKLTDIFDFKLNLPPLPEQKAIASILSDLDDKIELNLQMNKTLEEMAMALYKHWFVDFGPFKDGEFVESELGMIPKGWEVKQIGNLVETLGGGTPKTAEISYWENGDILWYSPTDLTSSNSLFSFNTSKKITKLGLQKSSAKIFPKGCLLMSSRATIGALTINTKEACTNQGFITMVPNKKMSVYELHGWTKTNKDLILSKANGSTFKEISKTEFRSLPIVFSNNKEGFNTEAEKIYKLIENNILEIEILKNQRDYLLPKLISGEIRVKDIEKINS